MSKEEIVWPIEHMKKIGAKGGKAGSGDAKRRSKEHYAKAARKRWAAYRKAKKEAAK